MEKNDSESTKVLVETDDQSAVLKESATNKVALVAEDESSDMTKTSTTKVAVVATEDQNDTKSSESSARKAELVSGAVRKNNRKVDKAELVSGAARKDNRKEVPNTASLVTAFDLSADLASHGGNDYNTKLMVCDCIDPSKCQKCASNIDSLLGEYSNSTQICYIMKRFPEFRNALIASNRELSTMGNLKTQWRSLSESLIVQLKQNLYLLERTAHRDRFLEYWPSSGFCL